MIRLLISQKGRATASTNNKNNGGDNNNRWTDNIKPDGSHPSIYIKIHYAQTIRPLLLCSFFAVDDVDDIRFLFAIRAFVE